MKIAFISVMEGAFWGGSEELWVKTATHALEQGHQVMVSVFKHSITHPKIERLKQQGASVFCRQHQGFSPDSVSSAPKPESKPRSVFWRRILRRIKHRLLLSTSAPKPTQVVSSSAHNSSLEVIRSFNPDIICVSQGGCYDLAYMPLGSFLCEYGIPFFVFCHSYDEINFPNDQQRAQIIKLFEKARQVFMVAKHQIATVERQIAKHFPNFYQIQNPLNLLDAAILPFPPRTVARFANVASLDVIWKGQDLLLEVLSQPQWRDRSWELNLFGLGRDQAYLVALTKFYGIAERVFFRGYVQDVMTIWENNHLLINPSRIDSGPMTLLESLLCGRPVVATNVGLAMEQVEDGRTGFIAPAATVPLLADTLERAWHCKDHWSNMGAEGFYKAIKQINYNPEVKLLARIIAFSQEPVIVNR